MRTLALAFLLGGLTASAWAGPFENPLIRAAYFGDAVAISRLVARGVDVDARDNHGMTALMWASYRGNEQVVQLLLSAKANVDAKSDAGVTAASAAKRGGHAKIARWLATFRSREAKLEV